MDRKRRSESEELPLLENKENQHKTNINPHGVSSVLIKIDVPSPLREEPRFPKEKWKTFIAFVVLVGAFICTVVSLSLVHDRLPDRDIYGPLPDIILDSIDANDWALDISEILIMIVMYSSFTLILFHKHRFIVLRRLFLIISILYFMRAITMYVTVLPVPSKTYYCSPKSNDTSAFVVIKRSLKLMTGFGLSIYGKHTYCGDYIYSGHTVMLVLGYLVISEYSPKRFYLLHWMAWTNALIGVLMISISHSHYTIDILIAYYVTTRLFWTFHTLANQNLLCKQQTPHNNLMTREWWFSMVRYFEQNVRGPVPKQFEWPFSWPRWAVYNHFSARQID